jgi:hypothetical protein
VRSIALQPWAPRPRNTLDHAPWGLVGAGSRSRSAGSAADACSSNARQP